MPTTHKPAIALAFPNRISIMPIPVSTTTFEMAPVRESPGHNPFDASHAVLPIRRITPIVLPRFRILEDEGRVQSIVKVLFVRGDLPCSVITGHEGDREYTIEVHRNELVGEILIVHPLRCSLPVRLA